MKEDKDVLDLAEVYCCKGKPDEAIILCQNLMEGTHSVGNPHVYKLLGRALEICGRFEEAVDVYKKSLLYAPQDSRSFLEIGKIYQLNNQYDLAIEYYREAIEKDQNSAYGYWMLGNLLKQREQNAEATSRTSGR